MSLKHLYSSLLGSSLLIGRTFARTSLHTPPAADTCVAHNLFSSAAYTLPSCTGTRPQGVCGRMLHNFEHENDPNNFLEEVLGEKALKFVNERNAHALTSLGDPEKSATYSKVLSILDSKDKIPHPTLINDHLYNFWTDDQHKRGIWRRTKRDSYRAQDTQWETVLDLDILGAKEGVSWVWEGYEFLHQGADVPYDLCLLSLSRGGADAVVVREFSLSQMKFLADLTKENCADDTLLSLEPFYAPEAKTRAEYKGRDVVLIGTDVGGDSQTDSGYPRTVMEWRRGTPLTEAQVTYTGEKADVAVSGAVSDQRSRGGRVYEWRHRSMTFYTSKQSIRTLTPSMENGAYTLTSAGDGNGLDGWRDVDIPEDAHCSLFGSQLIIEHRSEYLGHPAGSLLAVDLDNFLDKGAEDCAAEGLVTTLFTPTDHRSLEGKRGTKNYLLVTMLEDVKTKLAFWQWDQGKWLSVGEESQAQIASSSCRPVDSDTVDTFWFTTSSFTAPSTLYQADIAEYGTDCTKPENMEFMKQLPQMFNADGLSVQQMFATSADGTKVPYFVVGKEGMPRDGSTPTILYGYGGFEVSLTPSYASIMGAGWLERGGCYVTANIRGGGEYGPKWHRSALREKRQNAYDDFIAVARDLIAQGITSPKHLAARGGSNGGLLMGNMLVQQPKGLWGAIHCAVPLLDMRRYHTLLAGASWMAEYGNPDTADWDEFLHKYSAYHVLLEMTGQGSGEQAQDSFSESVIDTPILFTTSTRDDRVHPAHARKMVKALVDAQSKQGCVASPVYYYENIEGGHKGAADNKQQAFMQALTYEFLWKTVGPDANVD